LSKYSQPLILVSNGEILDPVNPALNLVGLQKWYYSYENLIEQPIRSVKLTSKEFSGFSGFGAMRGTAPRIGKVIILI
jgi:hypothetical protein